MYVFYTDKKADYTVISIKNIYMAILAFRKSAILFVFVADKALIYRHIKFKNKVAANIIS